jgi:hypothetical protein
VSTSSPLPRQRQPATHEVLTASSSFQSTLAPRYRTAAGRPAARRLMDWPQPRGVGCLGGNTALLEGQWAERPILCDGGPTSLVQPPSDEGLHLCLARPRWPMRMSSPSSPKILPAPPWPRTKSFPGEFAGPSRPGHRMGKRGSYLRPIRAIKRAHEKARSLRIFKEVAGLGAWCEGSRGAYPTKGRCADEALSATSDYGDCGGTRL